MAKNKIVRRVTGEKKSKEELARLAEIRRLARQDIPPLDPPTLQPAASGIGAQIRAARESQNLTWYALAKLAGVPNPAIIRDIEYGRDAKLSNVEVLATAQCHSVH
jgi:DNA-binding XRE family transcriptional regulator